MSLGYLTAAICPLSTALGSIYGLVGYANQPGTDLFSSSVHQPFKQHNRLQSAAQVGGSSYPHPILKNLSELPFSHFPRGNSALIQPHRTSQQLNHHNSTNHATHSKLTLLRRQHPPAIPSPPPPSRRPQQIQGSQRSGADVCRIKDFDVMFFESIHRVHTRHSVFPTFISGNNRPISATFQSRPQSNLTVYHHRFHSTIQVCSRKTAPDILKDLLCSMKDEINRRAVS